MSKVTTRKISAVPVSSSKTSRDLSYKPRFRHNYGSDETFYQFISNYKDKWEKSLYYVDEALVRSELEKDNLTPPQFDTIEADSLHINSIEYSELTKKEVENLFRPQLSLNVKQGSKSFAKKLQFGQSASLDDVSRRGLLLNTGGHVTSVKWLHTPLDNTSADIHYLAVSIINHPDGMEAAINSPELSIFHKKTGENTIHSAIQIWKYTLSTNNLSLEKVYVTTQLGATQNLSWLPIYVAGDDSVLGVLAGSFTDGNLHLFKISTKGAKYVNVDKPSRTYTAKKFASDSAKNSPNVTTFGFIGSYKVLVGLTDGCIAEFIFPFHPHDSLADDGDDDDTIPSYIERVADSSISTIMIGEPAPEEYVVLVTSTGVQSCAYEYKNFLRGRLSTLAAKPLIRSTYNHTLKVYVATWAFDSTSFNFIRNPHEASNTLLKVDAFVTALSSSEIIGHPLNLTATSDGDVIVVNYSRKFLNGAKITNKSLKPLKLWKLTLNESQLELSADFEVIPAEAASQLPVSPPEVVVTSLAWNENVAGSSIYTAGTISGLLILERLDSAA
ncbi:predicted protein [Scheffersomyces stipitis CBS 6054]|uniref:Uncharacterized protein n=1 Tax=Scheffersomyces stipitis (strain ATCC 58785 / CBS 6054 / NBRC 10063 / NRRL Y-11545) TaxID=322104 RepID=A3LQF8_PICST|nr:predicted protein [Scheffersomyces stipitis CBS 6054]ABN64673.2 predicted protein [Scheffersomyces stipitis CBS 6054]